MVSLGDMVEFLLQTHGHKYVKYTEFSLDLLEVLLAFLPKIHHIEIELMMIDGLFVTCSHTSSSIFTNNTYIILKIFYSPLSLERFHHF